MEMHGAMDSGHLSVKGFSVDQLQHLPTHGTLTEVLENRASQVAELTGSYPNKRLNILDRPTLGTLASIRYFQKMRKHQAKLEDIYHSTVDLGKRYIPKGFGYLKDGLRFLRKIRGTKITANEEDYDWCGEHGCYRLDDFTIDTSYDSIYGNSPTLRKKDVGYIDAETAQATIAFREAIENGDLIIEDDSVSDDDEDIFQGQIRAAQEGYSYWTGEEISEKEAKRIILAARVAAIINNYSPMFGARRGPGNISLKNIRRPDSTSKNKNSNNNVNSSQNGNVSNVPVPNVKKVNPNGTFENAPYHGKTSNSVKSKAPNDGQAALNNSVSIGSNTTRRVGVSNGEIVVLDQTSPEVFHGHVRSWNELTPQMQSALRKAGLVNKKGKIIGD
jgi:hypothetical protein